MSSTPPHICGTMLLRQQSQRFKRPGRSSQAIRAVTSPHSPSTPSMRPVVLWKRVISRATGCAFQRAVRKTSQNSFQWPRPLTMGCVQTGTKRSLCFPMPHTRAFGSKSFKMRACVWPSFLRLWTLCQSIISSSSAQMP